MTREQCLEEAKNAVLKNRASEYSKSPEKSFSLIADFWNAYIARIGDKQRDEEGGIIYSPHLTSSDIAAMMALLKIARICMNNLHFDSWVDLAGYAACGAECSTGEDTDE